MTRDFIELKAGSTQVRLADESILEVTGIGSIYVNGFKLNNVLYVPKLKFNLISVPALTKIGMSVHFYELYCEVKSKENVIFTGSMVNDTYYVSSSGPEEKARVAQSVVDLWHQRLGHPGNEKLSKTLKYYSVSSTIHRRVNDNCTDCLMSKLVRRSYPTLEHRVSEGPLDLIYADVCGELPISCGGAKYFVVIVDDFSRHAKYTFSSRSPRLELQSSPTLPSTKGSWNERSNVSKRTTVVSLFRMTSNVTLLNKASNTI